MVHRSGKTKDEDGGSVPVIRQRGEEIANRPLKNIRLITCREAEAGSAQVDASEGLSSSNTFQEL